MLAEIQEESSLTTTRFVMEKPGVLREGITNSRIMLFSCSAYRSMCDTLFEQFKSGSDVILYRMGQGFARKLVGGGMLQLPMEEAIKVYQRLAYMAGWGNLKLAILDKDNVECITYNSAFVIRRTDVGSVSCYFLAGVLSTVASSLGGSEFVAREVECEVGGHENCKFTITRKKSGKE